MLNETSLLLKVKGIDDVVDFALQFHSVLQLPDFIVTLIKLRHEIDRFVTDLNALESTQ